MAAGEEIVSTDACRLMACRVRLTRQDQCHVPNHCERGIDIHLIVFLGLQNQKHVAM